MIRYTQQALWLIAPIESMCISTTLSTLDMIVRAECRCLKLDLTQNRWDYNCPDGEWFPGEMQISLNPSMFVYRNFKMRNLLVYDPKARWYIIHNKIWLVFFGKVNKSKWIYIISFYYLGSCRLWKIKLSLFTVLWWKIYYSP